jgi:hypothetical protein
MVYEDILDISIPKNYVWSIIYKSTITNRTYMSNFNVDGIFTFLADKSSSRKDTNNNSILYFSVASTAKRLITVYTTRKNKETK